MKADVADLQQQKADQLTATLARLKNQFVSSNEAEHSKLARNQLIESELEQRRQDYENISRFAEIQMQQNASLKKQQEDEQLAEMKKQLEKKALEKFNFHMDKYYQYIDNSIDANLDNNQIEAENQYQAPPPTSAIQVKCLKTNFGKTNIEYPIPGDDNDYVMATFRYTKKETMDDLKYAALKYWNLLDIRRNDFIQRDKQDADQSQLSNQMNEMERANDQKRNLRKFEIMSEDMATIQNTELLDRYLQTFSLDQSKMYFTVILKKKKQRNTNRRVHDKNQDHRSQTQTQSQNKSGDQTITDKGVPSTNINTNNIQSGIGQQSLVSQSEEGQLAKIAEEEEEDDEDDDGQNQQDDALVKRLKIPLYQKYIAFFKRFPLIKKMMVIDSQEVEERGTRIQKQIKLVKKGMNCDDNNVCVIFVLIVLLIINVLFITLLQDGQYIQSHLNKIQEHLNVGDYGVTGSFMDITTLSDVYDYLANVQGMPYQLCDVNAPLSYNYETIGAIRIRQIRMKETKCKYPVRKDVISQVQCAYEYQSPTTVHTDKLYDGSQPWMFYKSVSQVGIGRTTEGTFATYDSSGFFIDIPKTKQNIKVYSQKVIQEMLDRNNYLSIQTFAMIWTFNLRCKNDGTFFFLEFLVEYSSAGIFPKLPTILPFSPNIFGMGLSEIFSVQGQKESEPPTNPIDYQAGLKLYILNIAKVLLGIFYVYFLIMKIINHFSDSQNKGFKYFISLTFILNLLVIYTTYQSCDYAFQHSKLNLNLVDLQAQEEFIDLGQAAELYNTLKIWVSINLCVLIIRIFMFLSFFRSLEAVLNAVESQYLQLFASFIMLGFNLIGFTFVGMSLWGPYLETFSTALRSIISLILITIGCFDKDSLIKYNLEYSIVYIICFYFLIFTFMFNILAVIYIDSYRLLILSEGELVQEEWTKMDWIMWAFSWVPKSIMKKFNQALEAVQNQIE